jgi:hypothetical protein
MDRFSFFSIVPVSHFFLSHLPAVLIAMLPFLGLYQCFETACQNQGSALVVLNLVVIFLHCINATTRKTCETACEPGRFPPVFDIFLN